MAFTVMTWNVENLFRPGHDSGPTTDDVYRDKLAGLTAMINRQAPDAAGGRPYRPEHPAQCV